MSENIKETIQKNKMSKYQMVVVAICLMINMLDGFDVLVMAFTAASVAQEWQLVDTAIGLLLSAGLIGMACGSVFIAPLADRLGRPMLVLVCLVVISLGMMLSAVSQNLQQLIVLRVFTGLGIGGMLASLNVIVAEYASDKWRSFALSLLQTGYPIGAVIGGTIAAFLIVHSGWRSVFLFGAIASLVMIPLVIWRLPESLDFLLAKRPVNALQKINFLLNKMGKSAVKEIPVDNNQNAVVTASLNTLFKHGMQRTTLLVWISYFMVMFSFYFVLSWTPKLLVEAGLSKQMGISAGVIINLGGVIGGILLGVISSKFSLKKIIGFYMLATAIFMMIFALGSANLLATLVLGVLIGFFLFGSMIGLYAMVPDLYPAIVRATGMGWAIGVGRIGAILSPMFAGLLLDWQWQGHHLFFVFAIPLLLSVLTVMTIKAGENNRS